MSDKIGNIVFGPYTPGPSLDRFEKFSIGPQLDKVAMVTIPKQAYESLQDQRDRLAKALRDGVYAPSRAPICVCRNINAVKAGVEKACWYCTARALLAEVDRG